LVRTTSIRATSIDGLILIERRLHADDRGTLDRLFDDEEISRLLPGFRASQVNHSVTTRRGTVRGMHYQTPPNADAKVVICLRGRVFDVAVDVRYGSETFLQWHAEVLEPGKNRSVVIPEGFAHGFQALTDECELLYVHGVPYHAEAEAGLRPNDPALEIGWPEPPLLMSKRDMTHPLVTADWQGVRG
jgi:dTDP-4-dehydrorhamnose 3,5-epimerase